MTDESPHSSLYNAKILPPESSGAHHTDNSPMPSDALLRGRKAVAIVHNGMFYTLQTTKLGKLILTK